MYSTFQDKKKLYFILQYCPNRDFSDLIRSRGKLTYELTKFYAAEIVSALEYMSKKGIYHRDLKPENILMDDRMHIKICDFSTAVIEGMKFDKRINKFVEADKYEQSSTSSENEEIYDLIKEFVGTPEYVSPEVITRKYEEISRSVDLWALGCIIYRCLKGHTPFKHKNNQIMFEKIVNVNFVIDSDLDENAQDIIKKLIVRDPKLRLGAGSPSSKNDFEVLKSHPFFSNINWDNLPSTEPPIDVCDLTLSMAGIKIFEEHESLTPIRRVSKIEKKLNSFTEAPQFIYDISVVDKTEEEKQEKEEIIFECKKYFIFTIAIVQKKSPWFHYNTRLLRLFSNAKLEYLEPKTLKLKGTIKLNPECKAILVDEGRFDLDIKQRTYIFKVPLLLNFQVNSKLAGNWVEKINNFIKKLKV